MSPDLGQKSKPSMGGGGGSSATQDQNQGAAGAPKGDSETNK